MKLKCRLVRIVLAGACSGESLPSWVGAHLARCGECRAEVAASARLVSFLESHNAEGTYSRTWVDVRAELTKPIAPERVRLPRPVLEVAAVCLVAFAIAASVIMWPVRQPARKQIIVQNPPVRQERRETVQQAAPQPVRVKRSVPRPRGLMRPDPSLIAREQPERDTKPSVVAIAPEEHVIGVVGVTIDRGNEDDYVIREVSAADEEASAVKL